MLLIAKYKKPDALASSKARYEAFMKEWGDERRKKNIEIAQHEYPAMRDVTGQYNVREITLTNWGGQLCGACCQSSRRIRRHPRRRGRLHLRAGNVR